MLQSKKIVILCYSFPPNTGVGGRRWAKFTKYLARKKKQVIAITAMPNKKNSPSFYHQDVKGVPTYYFKTKSPFFMSGVVDSLVQKIGYRWHLALKRMLVKGTPFDLVGRDGHQINAVLEQVKGLEGMNCLIATGAPFHLLYFASKFKQKHPEIKLVVDLRDPWVEGGNYGISSLSKKKYEQENQKEAFVMTQADFVTSPNQGILNRLMLKYPQLQKSKFKLIPHGYDEDYVLVKKNEEAKPVKKMVYIGTIYTETEEHLSLLNKILIQAAGQLTISFYTSTSDLNILGLRPAIEKGYVVFYEPVSEKELFKKLVMYDMVLLFVRNNYGQDFISTKFYELAKARLPMLGIGGKGKAMDFIIDNKLGITVTNFNVDVVKLITKIASFKLTQEININQYSYENITTELINQLEL